MSLYRRYVAKVTTKLVMEAQWHENPVRFVFFANDTFIGSYSYAELGVALDAIQALYAGRGPHSRQYRVHRGVLARLLADTRGRYGVPPPCPERRDDFGDTVTLEGEPLLW